MGSSWNKSFVIAEMFRNASVLSNDP